jgi:hypothetical protein
MLLHPEGHDVPQQLLESAAGSFREFFYLPEEGVCPQPSYTIDGSRHCVGSVQRWVGDGCVGWYHNTSYSVPSHQAARPCGRVFSRDVRRGAPSAHHTGCRN